MNLNCNLNDDIPSSKSFSRFLLLLKQTKSSLCPTRASQDNIWTMSYFQLHLLSIPLMLAFIYYLKFIIFPSFWAFAVAVSTGETFLLQTFLVNLPFNSQLKLSSPMCSVLYSQILHIFPSKHDFIKLYDFVTLQHIYTYTYIYTQH